MKFLEAVKEIKQNNKRSKELVEQISKAGFRQERIYYSCGFFVEGGIIKFYIRNQDGCRVNLYYVTLKELIKDLKLLEKTIKEAELNPKKEEPKCKKLLHHKNVG